MSRPYEYMTMKPGPQSIVDIRSAMHSLSNDLLAGRVSSFVAGAKLKQLAESTKRKSPIGVARRKIAPLSEQRKQEIRAFYKQWPMSSQLELAIRFNTNPGRISEALNEFR